jgi:hypothetical protein
MVTLCPYTSFPIHCILLLLQFEAVHSELLVSPLRSTIYNKNVSTGLVYFVSPNTLPQLRQNNAICSCIWRTSYRYTNQLGCCFCMRQQQPSAVTFSISHFFSCSCLLQKTAAFTLDHSPVSFSIPSKLNTRLYFTYICTCVHLYWSIPLSVYLSIHETLKHMLQHM